MIRSARKFDAFVLRYVPNVLEDKFVNIGVLMRERDSAGFAACRFLHDWGQVQSFDPDADIAMLASLSHEIEAGWKQPLERAALLRRMLTSYSGSIQLSLAETILTDDPAQALEHLASILPSST